VSLAHKGGGARIEPAAPASPTVWELVLARRYALASDHAPTPFDDY
jgi:hypothetical protein